MQKSGPQHGLTLILYIGKYIIIQHHLTALDQYKLLETIVPSIDLLAVTSEVIFKTIKI